MAPKNGLTPAKQRERRSKILAIVFSVVFVGVLAFQLPKLMKGSQHTTAITAAPPAAQAATAGAVAPGSTGGSTATGTPPPAQLTSFDHFSSKDPFRAQVSAASSDASGTSGSSGKAASASGGGAAAAAGGAAAKVAVEASPATPAQPGQTAKSTPAKTATATKTAAKKPARKVKPKPLPPNAALILMNGKKQLIPVGLTFPTKNPLFKLVALGKKKIRIGVLGGSFTDGAPTLAVKPGQKLTLANLSDGTRYVVRLLRLVAVTQQELAALEPQPTTPGAATTPAATTPAATLPAVPAAQPTASVPAETTPAAATTTPAATGSTG